MICIKEYIGETILIDDHIEDIEIEDLKCPLLNLPMSLTEIYVVNSINIFKRENRVPYGCKLTIENIIINDLDKFNRMSEEDYEFITEIDFTNCKLTELPKKISKLVNLRDLILSNNKITTIPDWIGNLKKLQILHLSYNKITKIPDSIGNLTNLQILFLLCNKITEIPDSIGKCVKLEKIDLNQGNNIMKISNSIFNLPKLKKLSLSSKNTDEIEKIIPKKFRDRTIIKIDWSSDGCVSTAATCGRYG